MPLAVQKYHGRVFRTCDRAGTVPMWLFCWVLRVCVPSTHWCWQSGVGQHTARSVPRAGCAAFPSAAGWSLSTLLFSSLSQILRRKRVNETRESCYTASSPAVWLIHVITHTTSFQVCPPQSYTEKQTGNRKAQKCAECS